MPSKKNIEQYEDLSEKFSRAKAVYFTEYHGLKVGEITTLRNKFFKSDVEYLVAKNTLLRKVVEDRKIKGLDDVLKGSTAIAISYHEPVSPAKVIKDFTKESDLPSVKGILFEAQYCLVEILRSLLICQVRMKCWLNWLQCSIVLYKSLSQQ